MKTLLFTEVAKLFCRDGIEWSMLDSPLLDPRLSSGSNSAGKAQAYPFVGAAAMGSGIPDTLRGLGLITGARRGGCCTRGPALGPKGESGETPFGRCSAVVIPRCCCRLETRETRETFWLSYGDAGPMFKWPMPILTPRLSTLLRRDGELASMLRRFSKPWLGGGRALFY